MMFVDDCKRLLLVSCCRQPPSPAALTAQRGTQPTLAVTEPRALLAVAFAAGAAGSVHACAVGAHAC
jgi:hypothetical protein